MIDIQKLKRQKADLVAQMRSIIDAVESRDDKSQSDEERATLVSLQDQAEKLDAQIRQGEFINSQDGVMPPLENENREAFQDFGEFITAVRNGEDSRLESRDVTMGDGASAGFLVPEQFDTELRAIAPQASIIRPRAMVIPAGTPPDAAINLISLDQSGDKGVYSGVVMKWVAETGTREAAGDPTVKPVKIEPQELVGYVDISDKLLRNSAAAGAMLTRLLGAAIIGAEEDSFMNGDGVGKPLGILSSKAVIEIPRDTAGKISYVDLVTMFSVAMGSNSVWLASQTAVTDLMTMVAPNTNVLVWQPNAVVGSPGSIFGVPVMYNDYSPVKGGRGDIALVDLDYYAIKDGSGLGIFMDPYTKKGQGVTRVYASWNVDGQSMLSDSLLKPDGETRVSPFVALKA